MNKKALLVLSSLLILSMLVFVGAGAAENSTSSSGEEGGEIKVYGDAEVTAEPDFASIVLGVNTTITDVKGAAQDNAEKMDSVIEALKDFGIDKENIKTGAYRVTQHREKPENREEYGDRFEVTNQVELTVPDTDNVGEAIDLAINTGANKVLSLNFELKEQEALKLKALQLATKQAFSKGEAIAQSADVQIKGVKSITEEMARYTPYRAEYGMGEREMVDEAAETPVVPGDIEVQARVKAEYLLK